MLMCSWLLLLVGPWLLVPLLAVLWLLLSCFLLLLPTAPWLLLEA
jgi:hypothetical protein